MSKFLADIKDWVHSLTTSDHYASYDPSRSSNASSRDQEQPLATEYPSFPHAAGQHTNSAGYQQGSRTEQFNARTATGAAGTGDIQMSEYDASAVPSPTLAWERIDKWIEQHYPELFDQLQYPATNNDLDELEHDLDCHLPPDVRESYLVHDGQERGGRPTGLFFGITLLDLESLSEEWAVWRNTAVRLNDMRAAQARSKATGPSAAAQARGNTARNEWAERQQSVPTDTVQPVYAHPGWVPLAKDFGGNNIGVDLAPGPRGHVGQVILFGRDFDTKFVVAESWGHFLDQFATDLESGNSFIDDDIEDAVFAYRLPTGRLTSYFSVLRSRIERQFRRTSKTAAAPTSQTATATSTNATGGSGTGSNLISPAGSQTSLAQSTDVEETVIKLTPASPLVNTAEAKMPTNELQDLSLSDSTSTPDKQPETIDEEVHTEVEETPMPEAEPENEPEPETDTKPDNETGDKETVTSPEPEETSEPEEDTKADSPETDAVEGASKPKPKRKGKGKRKN